MWPFSLAGEPVTELMVGFTEVAGSTRRTCSSGEAVFVVWLEMLCMTQAYVEIAQSLFPHLLSSTFGALNGFLSSFCLFSCFRHFLTEREWLDLRVSDTDSWHVYLLPSRKRYLLRMLQKSMRNIVLINRILTASYCWHSSSFKTIWMLLKLTKDLILIQKNIQII